MRLVCDLKREVNCRTERYPECISFLQIKPALCKKWYDKQLFYVYIHSNMSSKILPGHKDPVLDIARECLGFNVRKTARILARAYDKAFLSCELKSTQFPILVVLHTKGQTFIRELAKLLDLDRTTLTRNLVPLVRRGLIQVEEGTDRRTQTVTLTESGEALLQQALPRWQKLQARLISAVGREHTVQLLDGLQELSDAASK